MNYSLMFSIIVPVYNMEQYIVACLDSILKQQTNFNYEVIIVDDGSTDSSLPLCRAYCLEQQAFHLYEKTNGGLGSARNYGLVNAKGHYILFLDSDDRLRHDALQQIGDEIVKHPESEIIRFGFSRVNKDGEFQHSTTLELPTFSSILSCRSANSACLQAYKRGLFNDIRFTERRYYEDLSTVFKLYYKAKHIRICKENLYYYYEREGSITDSLSEHKVDDIFFACTSAEDFLKENEVLDIYQSALNERVVTLTLSVLKKLYDDSANSPLYGKTISTLCGMINTKELLSFFLRENHELLHDFTHYIYPGYYDYHSRLSLYFSRAEQALINNYKQSWSMNKLSIFLDKHMSAHNKIVLYGYGVVGRYCHFLLKGKVTAIVDKAYLSFDHVENDIEVTCPTSLVQMQYDKVFITVFGREEIIKNYLINECHVDYDDIIIFDAGV